MAFDPVAGDSSAVLDDATVSRLRAMLVRFLRGRTSDTALAEDLAQESLVHIVRGLSRQRDKASLDAWARRIALNAWRDYGRRMAARPAESDGPPADDMSDARGLGGPGAAPDDEHDRRTTHQCLLEATRALPVAARRVLLLCDFGDMSLAEAAASLGCSEGAAKLRLHRARKQLAEICRAQCRCEREGDAATCTPVRPEPVRPSERKRTKR